MANITGPKFVVEAHDHCGPLAVGLSPWTQLSEDLLGKEISFDGHFFVYK